MIIPSPYSDCHQHYFSDKNISEPFFSAKASRELICMTKKHYVRPVQVCLRFNFSNGGDVNILAGLNFEVKNHEMDVGLMFVVTHRNGEIAALSKKAMDYFEVGENILESCYRLSPVFQLKIKKIRNF